MSPPDERFTWQSTTVVFAPGSLDRADDAWAACLSPPHRIALLCGRESMRRSGILERLRAALSRLAPTAVYDGIGREPTPETVDSVAAFLRSERPGAVVALGGGSVIDTAKAANCAAAAKVPTRDLLRTPERARRAVPRFVAVPTTAGTGSEVTPFATLWDLVRLRKLSLEAVCNLPDLALVDPSVSMWMGPDLTRQTAADALGHALEALWSRRRSSRADALALSAVELIAGGLPEVHANPHDLQARTRVQRGSLLAGMAISLTRTAAAHAVSYGLTLRHGIPHGFAVGELLPGVLRVTESALSGDVRDRLARLLGADGGDLPTALARFMEREGLLRGLGAFGVTAADLPRLVEDCGDYGRMDNSVLPIGPREVLELLDAALSRAPSLPARALEGDFADALAETGEVDPHRSGGLRK